MADTQTSSRTGIIIGVAGGAVVLLLIAAVVFGTNEVGSEYGAPVVEGQALPLMPSGQTIDTSATGLSYPDVTGENFSGSKVVIDNADGRAKGIVFLAHWCVHCQAEVPRVKAWLDATGGVDGVDLYAVTTSINSAQNNYPPSDWLDREGFELPVIRDDKENSVLLAYGAGGFPYWVFTNADGTVALRTSGELSSDQLENILTGLEQ